MYGGGELEKERKKNLNYQSVKEQTIKVKDGDIKVRNISLSTASGAYLHNSFLAQHSNNSIFRGS